MTKVEVENLLKVMKVLRDPEKGCPWDLVTCYFAAINGHLECLRYAHENGCPGSESMRIICNSFAFEYMNESKPNP